jgi:hypothetical protein
MFLKWGHLIVKRFPGVARNFSLRRRIFLAFGRIQHPHKVNGAEALTSHPMVQGVIAADKALLKVHSRTQSYGLVPIPVAGLHHGLHQNGAAVSGGRIKGKVGAARTDAPVEFKPQTIYFLRTINALTAERTNRRQKPITGRI